MVKSVSTECVKQSYPEGNRCATYQQALDDFGITELLSHLSNFSDADFDAAWLKLQEYEMESLAAILIQRLTHTLQGKLIASYMNYPAA